MVNQVKIKAALFCATVLITALCASSCMQESGDIPELSGKETFFTILHTNDEHSSLIPHSPAVDHDPESDNDPTKGGFARLASAVENIRSEKKQINEPVLLFNAGDFMGGDAYCWLIPQGYAPELDIMQTMGYDAVVIGNHEYDYGPEVLGQYLLKAGYPRAHGKTAVLASNTRVPDDYLLKRENLLLETVVFPLENGPVVGVFGMIGNDAISVTSDTGEITFDDQIETARRMVKKLKGEGADVIVAITHSGVYEDIELAREVPEINLVVGGHCHTSLKEPLQEGGTIIAQTGSRVKNMGYLELAYNAETGKLRTRNRENNNPFLIRIDSSFSPHPQISGMVEQYTSKLNSHISVMTGGSFNDIMKTLVRSGFEMPARPPMRETPAANFITDAMRFTTAEVTGRRVDVAIQANGSIRGGIKPGTQEHSYSDISFYDIVGIMALGYGDDGYAGYPVVSTYLTGEEILRALEVAVLISELMGDTYFLQFSGLRYSCNPSDAVLFTIPFLNQPLPTVRAVKSAELYAGEGIQPAGEGDFIPLVKGDDRLYHVVTDIYLLSFLPMAGDLLPQLKIVPKKADGEPVSIENLRELVVRHPDGRELKGWETLVRYASSQPPGEDGVPRMDKSYSDTSGRINHAGGFPYIGWVYVCVVIIGTGIYLLLRRRRMKR